MNSYCPNITSKMKDQHGKSLDEVSRESLVLTLFLRHPGCTFCRQSLSAIRDQKLWFEENGIKLFLVHLKITWI